MLSFLQSRPPARTRGLKLLLYHNAFLSSVASSREDAWIETCSDGALSRWNTVASSREDAWIETTLPTTIRAESVVASSREDAWIETGGDSDQERKCPSRPPARTRGLKPDESQIDAARFCRVLPRGRVD